MGDGVEPFVCVRVYGKHGVTFAQREERFVPNRASLDACLLLSFAHRAHSGTLRSYGRLGALSVRRGRTSALLRGFGVEFRGASSSMRTVSSCVGLMRARPFRFPRFARKVTGVPRATVRVQGVAAHASAPSA